MEINNLLEISELITNWEMGFYSFFLLSKWDLDILNFQIMLFIIHSFQMPCPENWYGKWYVLIHQM